MAGSRCVEGVPRPNAGAAAVSHGQSAIGLSFEAADPVSAGIDPLSVLSSRTISIVSLNQPSALASTNSALRPGTTERGGRGLHRRSGQRWRWCP